MNQYYVYAYLRENDTKTGKKNEPYYIGKGQKDRAYDPKHLVSVPKNKNQIVFLEKNLSEIGAYALERRYIAWYGRVDQNTGVLHNKTDGGEGVSLPGEKNGMYGRRHSQESISKIKAARAKQIIHKTDKRRNASLKGVAAMAKANKGRKLTDEHKKKVSISLTGRPGSKKLVGVPKSEEHKLKISQGRLNGRKAPETECPHCNKNVDPGNYRRWHGDNCKLKI